MKRSRNLEFNGAFGSPEKAARKKRKVANGFIVRRKVRGEMRFIVMSKKPGRKK